MFYYKVVDENGVIQRLFTSNYKEYSSTEITEEEYEAIKLAKHNALVEPIEAEEQQK